MTRAISRFVFGVAAALTFGSSGAASEEVIPASEVIGAWKYQRKDKGVDARFDHVGKKYGELYISIGRWKTVTGELRCTLAVELGSDGAVVNATPTSRSSAECAGFTRITSIGRTSDNNIEIKFDHSLPKGLGTKLVLQAVQRPPLGKEIDNVAPDLNLLGAALGMQRDEIEKVILEKGFSRSGESDSDIVWVRDNGSSSSEFITASFPLRAQELGIPDVAYSITRYFEFKEGQPLSPTDFLAAAEAQYGKPNRIQELGSGTFHEILFSHSLEGSVNADDPNCTADWEHIYNFGTTGLIGNCSHSLTTRLFTEDTNLAANEFGVSIAIMDHDPAREAAWALAKDEMSERIDKLIAEIDARPEPNIEF